MPAIASAVRHDPMGRRVFDVRDYGVKFDSSSNATTNRIGLQAALDAATSVMGVTNGALVDLPLGTMHVDRPVHIDPLIALGQPGLWVVGKGEGSKICTSGANAHDPIALGITRTPGGQAVATSDFIDLHGILDTSAASATGQKWGFRTRQDWIIQRGGHFDTTGIGAMQIQPQGNFQELRYLTIDFAVDLSYGNTALLGNVALMGLTQPERVNAPGPWRIRMQKSGSAPVLTLQLYVSDGGHLSGTQYNLAVTLTGFTFQRVTVQIDLVAGTVDVWAAASGIPKKLAITGTPPPAGSYFVPNYLSVFGVGCWGPIGAAPALNGGEITWDFLLAGLKASNVLRYATGGATGSDQAMIGGGTNTDALRYFTTDANTLGLFRFNDAPATAAADRVLTTQSGRWGTTNASAYLANAKYRDYIYPAHNIHLRNFTIQGGSQIAGTALAVGQAVVVTLADMTIQGGLFGIGCKKYSGSWSVIATNCRLGGRMAYVEGLELTAQIRDCITTAPGARVPLLLDDSHINVDGLRLGGSGDGDYLFFLSATHAYIRNFWSNFEGGNYPNVAGIYASNRRFKTSALTFEDCFFGTVSYDHPLFILHEAYREGGASATNRCTVRMRGIGTFDYDQSAFLKVDSPVFSGEIEVEHQWGRPRDIEDDTGGVCNLKTIRVNLDGPPREGMYVAGCNVVKVSRPVDGRPRVYRCSATGGYGQATPPEWRSHEIEGEVEAPSRLGCDGIGHSYWTAGSTRDDAQGFWADRVHLLVLNRLFKGTAFTAPSALYMGLHNNRAWRTTTRWEVLGSKGYTRQAVTPTLGGDGDATIGAFTFGPATADWQGDWPAFQGPADIGSVGLYDAATAGNPIAAVDLDRQRVLNTESLAFASGDVELFQAPTVHGGFSRAFETEVTACFLSGTALASRTVYLALSTAVADPESGPTEPSGGSYARKQTATTDWTTAYAVDQDPAGGPGYGGVCITRSATVLNFAAPTGAWGTVRSLYLMDAATSGNVIGAFNLTRPKLIASGDPAHGFDVGGIRITRA